MEHQSGIPAVAKGGLAVGGAGVMASLGYYLKPWQDKGTLLIFVGGLVGVALLLVAYRTFLRYRDRQKDSRIRAELTGGSRRPHEIADPEERAKLDDLTKKFEGGLDKYRTAGKNVYSLPWYLLVGEPGSGKTEALRHCNVPSPAGLGELPGVGGTINMNWWFTNHGVVLDTAGRIMFRQVEAGQTGEWRRFLELLNKARPNCPVNGLLLVIPAESLILDTADKIQEKATKIARQLDLVQRTLGVRFPVFVVITKSDLINGFRSFFDSLNDPQLQHQILGWSNPAADLDAPFDPELVSRHLRDVRERLLKRRMGLILDPVNTEDPSARRADQVDDLYSFPDSMEALAPRLRQYLETIFVQGEWSPKPLFLRGIYFTSSMRQGPALDKELADALGVPVDSLPEGRVWDQERAYFLRDLFMKKIFPERGLVTRAAKATGLYRRRKVASMAAGFLAVAALLGLSYFGHRQMDARILSHQNWWAQLARAVPADADEEHRNKWNLVQVNEDATRRNAGRPQYEYFGAEPAIKDESDQAYTFRQLHAEALGRLQANLAVPYVFRPVAGFEGDLAAKERRTAYRNLFNRTVLRPVVDAARDKLKDAREAWTPEAADALAQLVRLDAAAAPGAAAPGPASKLNPPVRLDPLYRYVLGANSDAYKGAPKDKRDVSAGATGFKDDEAVLQASLNWLYSPAGGGEWPPAEVGAATDASRGAIAGGVDRMTRHWQKAFTGDLSNRPGDVTDLRLALAAFEAAEAKLLALPATMPNGPQDLAQYAQLLGAWRPGLEALAAAEDATTKQAERVRARPRGWPADETLLDLYTRDLGADLARAQREFDLVLGEIPQSAGGDAIDKLRTEVVAAQNKLPRADAPPIDPAVREQFERFQKTYLAPAAAGGGGGPDNKVEAKYQAYVRAFRAADAKLPDPAANFAAAAPPPGVAPAGPESFPDQLAKLAARVAAVAADVKAAAGAVAAAAPRDGGHGDQVQDACAFAVQRMAGPCWGYAVVKAVIDGPDTPRAKDDFARLVAASGNQSEASAVVPALPFNRRGGERLKPEYHRKAASDLLARWLALGGTLGPAGESAAPAEPQGGGGGGGAAAARSPAGAPAAGRGETLDARALRDAYDARTAAAVAPYLDDYVAYWGKLLADARAVEVRDWRDFKARLPATADKVNKEPLAQLCNMIDEALTDDLRRQVARLAPGGRAAQAVAAARQDLLATRDALNPPATSLIVDDRFGQDCNRAVAEWRELDDDPAKAAAAAVARGVVEFDRTFLIRPDAGRRGNVALDYWTAVTSGGFAALVEANRDRRPNPAGECRQAYDRFPVAAPSGAGGGASLTAKEVADGRAAVAAVRARVADHADKMKRKDGRPLDPAFRKQFDGLGPTPPRPDEEEWLGRAEQVLAALDAADGVKQCTVRTMVLARQQESEKKYREGPPPAAANRPPLGRGVLNFVSLPNGAPAVAPFPGLAKDVTDLGREALSDDARAEARLQFKVFPTEPQPLPADVRVPGPWAWVRLLYAADAAYPDRDGRTWRLRVTQRPAADQPALPVWVEVEFADPLSKLPVPPRRGAAVASPVPTPAAGSGAAAPVVGQRK